MFNHGSAGFRGSDRSVVKLFQEIDGFESCGASQSINPTAFGRDRCVAPINLGIQARLREAQRLHRIGGRRQANLIDDKIRRGVVGIPDHQPHRVSQGQFQPGGKMPGKNSRTRHFVFILQSYELCQIQL